MIPRWHDGPLSKLTPGDGPVVWSVAIDGAVAREALVGIPANADDLFDAARIRNGRGRLLRRRLARALVARMADVSAHYVRLARTLHGAPVVVAPSGWHVSLSGRDGDCLIGVARQPIAVDREPINDAPPLRDMLTPAEIAAHDGLSLADQPLDWLRRWTIKEAHAKLIGEPLRIAPETIETHAPFVLSLSKDMPHTRPSTGSGRTGDWSTEAAAAFEGTSRCWTRTLPGAIETVALWA